MWNIRSSSSPAIRSSSRSLDGLRYPEAVEAPMRGRPTFRAGSAMFVVVGAEMARRSSIMVRVDDLDMPAIARDPRWFVPRYWGRTAWRGLLIDHAVDWSEIEEVIDASYRLVALKRQLASLDAHPLVVR